MVIKMFVLCWMGAPGRQGGCQSDRSLSAPFPASGHRQINFISPVAFMVQHSVNRQLSLLVAKGVKM